MEGASDQLSAAYEGKMHALWKTLTTGQTHWAEQYELEERLYADKLSEIVSNYGSAGRREAIVGGGRVGRELRLLFNEALEHSPDRTVRDEIIRKSNALQSAFDTGIKLEGRTISATEAVHLLAVLRQSGQRKDIWDAYMRRGAVVAPRIVELVELRNAVARAKGFSDYYTLKLESEEIGDVFMDEISAELQRRLDALYATVKQSVDEQIARTYGIASHTIRPWHYAHPFFQELEDNSPTEYSVDWKKLIPALSGWFRDRGVDLELLMRRGDFREVGSRHEVGFCLHANRHGDIRVSCSMTPDRRGLAVFLHELGHCLYESHIDKALPFILRQPAQILLSEAVAIMMESLSLDAHWLAEHGLLYPSEDYIRSFRVMQGSRNLIKLYGALTFVAFERRMYGKPDCDLNASWWELACGIQRIRPPEDWNRPYWAAKSHLSVLPAYYHHYLLGELAAAQLLTELERRFGVWHSIEGFEWLRDRLFRPGASIMWQALIENTTGRPLGVEAYVNQATDALNDL